MGGFSLRTRIDNFTAGKHPREKRLSTSIAFSHPAVGRADRLFEIIDPARCAIASAQAPGDLELASRTFGGGNERECFHLTNLPSANSRSELVTAGIKRFLPN